MKRKILDSFIEWKSSGERKPSFDVNGIYANNVCNTSARQL